jgi:peroxin-4
MSNARQRLLKEYKEATRQKLQDTGITLIPNESNLFAWKALLQVGP